jgi:hypothetical protein
MRFSVKKFLSMVFYLSMLTLTGYYVGMYMPGQPARGWFIIGVMVLSTLINIEELYQAYRR